MVSLIDTDVMIDLSREISEAAGYLDALSDPAISIITAQELIVGAKDKRDLHAIDSLVAAYRVIHVDSAIGQLAYELLKRYAVRRITNIRLTDCRYCDRTELCAG